jgi:hypothetical protein
MKLSPASLSFDLCAGGLFRYGSSAILCSSHEQISAQNAERRSPGRTPTTGPGPKGFFFVLSYLSLASIREARAGV